MAKKITVPEAPEAEVEVVAEPTPFDEFVEHERKALKEFGKAFATLVPEGVREHGETAVKEMVEGYRQLFNATLDDLVKVIEKAKIEERQPEKKVKVPIQ